MFPIRDHNPPNRWPYVTVALILINVVVFLSYQGLSAESGQLARFYNAWGMVPQNIVTGMRYDTLITCMFLHGGWMHIAGNMLFLWIFGDNLEDKLGHMGFLAFYLACGLLASAGQIVADPMSTVPTVGASGAVAGVLGGYLLLFPKARVDILLILVVFIRVFSVPAWVMLGLWFGFQVFNGVTSTTAISGVAYWAHIAGFVAGFVLIFPVWLRSGAARYWKQTEGHPPHPDATYKFAKSSIPRVTKRR